MKNLLLVTSDYNLIAKTQAISKELCCNCLISDYLRENDSVSLIVLEVSMKHNLSDLYMKIFRFRCRNNIPILVICNEGVSAKDKIVLLNLGVENYLVKPILNTEYKRNIEMCMNKHAFSHN